MDNQKSLSIIVPAYNEEGNIRATCEGIIALAQKHLSDYEILVFDDCSQDKTSAIVKDLQKNNSHVLLFRNPTNKGLGYNYRAGILKARCRYAMMVPGDNEVIGESLENVFSAVGTSDILVCYSANPEVRSQTRQVISNLFTDSLNVLFGLKLRYYNGTCVIRTDLAKEFLPSTNSFAYMAVLLVQLIKSGYSYEHYTFALRKRLSGTTKAFRLKNVVNVIKDILGLYFYVMIFRSHKRHSIPSSDPAPSEKLNQHKES